MPLYEYDCPVCGRFEVLQKFDDKPLKVCPTCSEKGKKTPVAKVLSAAAFHLKGTGWYKTDYASKSSSSNGSNGKSHSSSSSASSSNGTGSKTASKESTSETTSTKSSGSDSSSSGSDSGKSGD